MPLGGPALTVVDVTGTLNDVLKEKSPADLKMMNRKTLRVMGAGEKDTERFLNNNAFSTSQQTAFVLNLNSLGGVGNRGAFARTAGETSSNEQDAPIRFSSSRRHRHHADYGHRYSARRPYLAG
jgi:hypothetical protein